MIHGVYVPHVFLSAMSQRGHNSWAIFFSGCGGRWPAAAETEAWLPSSYNSDSGPKPLGGMRVEGRGVTVLLHLWQRSKNLWGGMGRGGGYRPLTTLTVVQNLWGGKGLGGEGIPSSYNSDSSPKRLGRNWSGVGWGWIPSSYNSDSGQKPLGRKGMGGGGGRGEIPFFSSGIFLLILIPYSSHRWSVCNQIYCTNYVAESLF